MQEIPFDILKGKAAYSEGRGAVLLRNEGKGEPKMTDMIHRNDVLLTGTALKEPEYSHSNHGERFYQFPLRILRLSGQGDDLIVTAGEGVLRKVSFDRGARLTLTGQLRSYNNKTGRGSRLVITVFAHSLESAQTQEDCNHITLAGVLCKEPARRNTPLGREICDIMLAVNRRYGRADYIPCIAWGALAGETGRLHVGDPLAFEGRIQSRLYHKATEQGVEERTAYEVSIMSPADDAEHSCIISFGEWS